MYRRYHRLYDASDGSLHLFETRGLGSGVRVRVRVSGLSSPLSSGLKGDLFPKVVPVGAVR